MWYQDERTPLWRNFSFTLMWTSAAASGFGDRMMMLAALALMGAMAGEAESTSINGAINFWFTLPYFVFALFAGWLADHLPRKWILLGCDEARAVILFFAYALVPAGMMSASIPEDQHWKVLAILFAIGTFAAVFSPAKNAIVPQLLPPKQLQAGNALLISITVIASMIGSVIGDLIINPDEAPSVRRALLLAVVIYGVSGTFFAFLRLHTHKAPKAIRKERTFKQAALYIFQHKRIVQLTMLHCLVWGVAFLVYSAPLAIGKLNFGWEGAKLQTHFVWMSATVGVGMLAGAAVVAWLGTRREAQLPMMTGLITTGVAIVILANSPWYPLTMLCVFLAGLCGNVTIISIMTLLQSIAPDYIRGRVMGLDSMNTTVASLLVTLLVWQMPNLGLNSDLWILRVLDVVGPIMTLIGIWFFVRYLLEGPMPNKVANSAWKLQRFFCLVWHRLEWHGRHHIPRTGPVILASNHTTGLDPFLIQSVSERLVRWLMLTSYRFPLLEPFWKAIDPICLEHNGGDTPTEPGMKQVRQIVAALKEGHVVGIFPEGHLQREHRVLRPFEPGVAVIARLSGAPIVPVWIEGTPRAKSIWMHLFRPSRSRVSFGAPMWIEKGGDIETATEELRRRMIALASVEVISAE